MLNEPWMDVPQVQEYLSLPKHRVYRAVQRGELPVHRIGCRLRFKKTEIDKAIIEIKQEQLQEKNNNGN